MVWLLSKLLVLLLLSLCCICKISSYAFELEAKIVNGVPTTASDYPFIAYLELWDPVTPKWWKCTGSVLQKEWPTTILTAAHCLEDVTKVIVYFLVTDIDHIEIEQHTAYKNTTFIIHSDWNITTFDNDIALIFLDESLEHNDYERISTVELQDDSYCGCWTDKALQVVGYGASGEFANITDTLEYTDLICIDNEECKNRYGHFDEYMFTKCNGIYNWSEPCLYNYSIQNYSFDADFPDHYQPQSIWTLITDNMICAIGDDTDTCYGDSGGPLIEKDTNIQIGITSWGMACNIGLPPVFTNICPYLSWIDQQIEKYTNNRLNNNNNNDNISTTIEFDHAHDDNDDIDVDTDTEFEYDECHGLTKRQCLGKCDEDGDMMCGYNKIKKECYSVQRASAHSYHYDAAHGQNNLNHIMIIYILSGIILLLLIIMICGGYFMHTKYKKYHNYRRYSVQENVN